jgi:hypothetical protein
MMPDPCPNDSKVITDNLMIQSAEMIKKKLGARFNYWVSIRA